MFCGSYLDSERSTQIQVDSSQRRAMLFLYSRLSPVGWLVECLLLQLNDTLPNQYPRDEAKEHD